MALWLDGESEFGESRREPMPWIGIEAEFVAAAAKILDESVPGADASICVKIFWLGLRLSYESVRGIRCWLW